MNTCVRAPRVAAAILCIMALAACAGRSEEGREESALPLKRNQTVAETDKDSRECKEKAGLLKSEPSAQPHTKSDLEIAPAPGRQYAFAAWVPLLIQGVGQGIGHGIVEANRQAREQEAKQQGVFHSCMLDKGYAVVRVTNAEYQALQSKATPPEKEAAMRALYAKYGAGTPPGVDAGASRTTPDGTAAPVTKAQDPNANQKPGK